MTQSCIEFQGLEVHTMHIDKNSPKAIHQRDLETSRRLQGSLGDMTSPRLPVDVDPPNSAGSRSSCTVFQLRSLV